MARLLALFVVLAQAEPPSKDLVGHWTLDDKSAADASGHGLAGKTVKEDRKSVV